MRMVARFNRYRTHIRRTACRCGDVALLGSYKSPPCSDSTLGFPDHLARTSPTGPVGSTKCVLMTSNGIDANSFLPCHAPMGKNNSIDSKLPGISFPRQTGTRMIRTPCSMDSRGRPGPWDVSTVTSWRLANSCANWALITPPPPPRGGYSKLQKSILKPTISRCRLAAGRCQLLCPHTVILAVQHKTESEEQRIETIQ